MFSSLLRRQRRNNRRVSIREESVSPPPAHQETNYLKQRHATADFTEADDDDETNDEGLDRFPSQVETRVAEDIEEEEEEEEEEEGEDDEDDPGNLPGQRQPGGLPVLPLFSATHMDALPVYSMTHAIRIIVCARTETTLTWDQLRSPQISQFLIKPMQQQIRSQHFSRATLYSLMANSLQFTKEGQRYAANAGTSNTRAKVCELLALKLLKEYSTRELIDALAYDFYPLQGLPGTEFLMKSGLQETKTSKQLLASRTSTLEVAILASAKHFLAHPVVVQQLEAIWRGAITFYSSADSLHRSPTSSPLGSPSKADIRTPLLGSLPQKGGHPQGNGTLGRRTAMLYDPREASLFKLSRLRVPKYRSFLSTVSLAVLIGLFLSVLAERSSQITGLELIFWFWSAGFMLDELVGFNEQGFSLYIMSFWNIFDLGILVLLIAYYCMRIYGVFLADPHHWNSMAYDVLAANAILLLPRIFSVLDHYQYFSQLLIAFKLMAVDLMAVFVLVLIACSGFFVFFTMANTSNDAPDVAYKIFQMIMGFSPAAWDVWPKYNFLARAMLVLFLFISHFLVVTILITVLTNSFHTIVSNATEEHQYLFAINTISMVKDNSLFSYVAPSNIFAWGLMPLRYCMPLKRFVWLNRTIIKVTHMPVLLCIYLYERFWLAPFMFEPTDLVERQGRGRGRNLSLLDPGNRAAVFSPNLRVREESVAGLQKDRALEEVFRRVPETQTTRSQRRNERRKQQNAIRHWMNQQDENGEETLTNWPTVTSRAAPPDWQRRLSVGWMPTNLRQVSDVRSTASDPLSNIGAQIPSRLSGLRALRDTSVQKDQTDADGDDELVTNDEDDHDGVGESPAYDVATGQRTKEDADDYFTTPLAAQVTKLPSSHSSGGKKIPQTPRNGVQGRRGHTRTQSTTTILFNPEGTKGAPSASPTSPSRGSPGMKNRSSGRNTGSPSPANGGRGEVSRSGYFSKIKPEPIALPRDVPASGGISRSALLAAVDLRPARQRQTRRLSSVDLSMMSDNIVSEDPNAPLAGSFQTQMAMAMMKDNRLRAAGAVDTGDSDRMGRLVLARMKTLEESFADVIKEMRDLKHSSTGTGTRWNSSNEDGVSDGPTGEGSGKFKQTRRRGDMTPRRPAARAGANKRGTGVLKSATTPSKEVKGKSPAYYSTEDE